jgi:hypothetical protein
VWCVGWKPDEIILRENGWQDQIRWRRAPGSDGGRSCIRKVVDVDGRTREVLHEVLDINGHIIHQHSKVIREEAEHASDS